MRRALWSSSLAALVALAPVTARAGLRPCRLPVRSAATEKPCSAPAAEPLPQYPHPRGLPALIFGASIFAFGLPTTIVGSLLMMDPDFSQPAPIFGPYAGVRFLIPGALMLLVGMPLTAVGAVRYERFRRQQDDLLARARFRPAASGFALHF
ncbi:MAG TPA: hypothetical protein VIK91_07125 [Nannocystis sp.]